MKKTTLQMQLEAISEAFDLQEKELREMRKKAISEAIKSNIDSGLLKSELE